MTVYTTCGIGCPVPCDGRCRQQARRYPIAVAPILDGLAAVDADQLHGWQSRFQAFADRLYDRDSLDEIPPTRPLIDGVLEAGAVTVLAGKHGTIKTFTVISMAGSVATGLPWLGHKIPEPGPVLFIVAEGASSFRTRVAAWEYLWNERKRIDRDRLIVHSGSVNLFDSTQAAMLGKYVAELQPRLVVVDTLRKCSAGAVENSNDDMGIVIGRAEEIAVTTGAAILFCHHAGHEGGRPRGASAIGDDSSGIWLATGDATLTRLENTKVKDGQEHPDISIRLVIEKSISSGSIEQVGTGDPAAADAEESGPDKVIRFAREQWGAAQFSRTTLRDALMEAGLPKATANRHITRAVETGHLDACTDTGRWLRVNLTAERSGS